MSNKTNARPYNAVATVGSFKNDKGDKVFNTIKIGVAWVNEETGMISVNLDLPVGITEYALFPPTDKK